MRSAKEIEALLPRLDHVTAASLEGQDLDFKQWPSSKADAASLAVEAAVCMANGGGGTIVFGVADKAIGRAKAIGGVPLDIDTNELWTFLRMKSDTAYLRREDGRSALPLAVERLFAQIMVENPIQTVTTGLLHFEYRTYPEIAVREALMNAFCHADFRRGSPILVKQYSDRLELTNPGGFIGGITPENILHHTPMARNPHPGRSADTVAPGQPLELGCASNGRIAGHRG